MCLLVAIWLLVLVLAKLQCYWVDFAAKKTPSFFILM